MAATIEVEEVAAGTFRVTVREGGSSSAHTVTAEPSYCKRLAGGRAGAADLVRRSFEFLLEREPKESILATFDLPVIGRYFPEYEREIARRVGG